MKFDVQRIIGWTIPLVCIAIAAFVLFRQHNALDQASTDLTTAQRQESAASAAKEAAEQSSGVMHFAAVPPSTSEESKFLDGVRAQAGLAAVKITRWNSRPQEAAAAAPASSPAEGDKKADPSTKNILRIKGDLTLTGSYQGIRAFLNALTRSNRLYTFSDLRWIRKDKGDVELTTTVTRYVDPTLTAAAVGGEGQKRT